MIKLYHIDAESDPYGGSRNAAKVSIALRELGLEFETINLDRERECRPLDAPFRKINPNGVTPAIDEEGFILWESSAILRYLADTRGGVLAMGDTRQTALVQQWLSWEAATLFRTCLGVFFAMIADPVNQQTLDAATVEYNGVLAVLDAQLQGQTYVAGVYSIADIALACVIGVGLNMNVPLLPYGNIVAWLARLEERSAWQQEQAFMNDMKAGREAGLIPG